MFYEESWREKWKLKRKKEEKRREEKSRGLKFEKILAPHIYFNLIVPQLIHIH